MVALSLVFLLGTVGNGLVIWFVIFKMKKTVTSVWCFSLALADFTFSLFQPFTVTYIALNRHWHFGSLMCKLNYFVVSLNMFSSILHLTVISIDRCLCVVFPAWCQKHRTPRLAWMVTLAVWILAAGCSVPYFILREAKAADDGRVHCSESFSAFMLYSSIIMRFIIFFVIPLIIIVSCYTVIIVCMRRDRMVTSTKTFKMIAAVIICFFICWGPFQVLDLTLEYIESNYPYRVLEICINIAFTLAAANSFLNPFLYVFFGRDFKKKFWSSIQSALRRAFTEDPNWTDTERQTTQRRDTDSHDWMPLSSQNVGSVERI
ncbi:chemerin-like receptor 1 [Gastrophryne carolinensis]